MGKIIQLIIMATNLVCLMAPYEFMVEVPSVISSDLVHALTNLFP